MSLNELIRLDGKRALVTGAGCGIGKGCALELAHSGADLILNDRPGSEDLLEVADEIRELGRKCWTIEADVFTADGCASLVSAAIGQAKTIDILVSNPAYGKRCGFLEYPADEFDRVIDATFKMGFHISQAVARHMVDSNIDGSIVFISSVVAGMPFERNAPYGPQDGVTHSLKLHGIGSGLANVMIEIRNDLLKTPEDEAIMTSEILTLLQSALASLAKEYEDTPHA